MFKNILEIFKVLNNIFQFKTVSKVLRCEPDT